MAGTTAGAAVVGGAVGVGGGTVDALVAGVEVASVVAEAVPVFPVEPVPVDRAVVAVAPIDLELQAANERQTVTTTRARFIVRAYRRRMNAA